MAPPPNTRRQTRLRAPPGVLCRMGVESGGRRAERRYSPGRVDGAAGDTGARGAKAGVGGETGDVDRRRVQSGQEGRPRVSCGGGRFEE